MNNKSGINQNRLAKKKNLISIKEIQSSFKDYFTNKPVKKAYFLGSYSKLEAIEKSDMDILVELDFFRLIGLFFFTMEYELKNRFNYNRRSFYLYKTLH